IDVPVVDGNADDACWSRTDWQEIGQTWMPYDAFVLSDDFTGRYKCVWNKDSNRIYFLVEIKDDALVDGYQFGNGDYYKYDVLELFVDEDNSGGMHRIDQGSQNAENAFAYHMNVDFPGIDNATSELLAMDQFQGTQIKNYANHFPEFVLKQYSHKNIYEFSLKLYSDDFDAANPEESRVALTENKYIGFSMAYCDNDDPDEYPKTRDNFFGSVEVAHQDSNNHWINADHFGTMKLVDTTSTNAIANRDKHSIVSDFKLAQNYPNPFNPATTIEYNLPEKSQVRIEVFDVTGSRVTILVNQNQNAGIHSVTWNASELPTGVYFYKISADHFTAVKKCMLIK
ncbi:MAG: sugar-binding protein, partial [bacterium]